MIDYMGNSDTIKSIIENIGSPPDIKLIDPNCTYLMLWQYNNKKYGNHDRIMKQFSKNAENKVVFSCELKKGGVSFSGQNSGSAQIYFFAGNSEQDIIDRLNKRILLK